MNVLRGQGALPEQRVLPGVRVEGGRGLVRRHWLRKQRAGETTGAGREEREAQGGQEERLEVEPQEIRGAPGGRGGERMWRGRWRDSGWKQRAGSGRTARARERPRGSWGGAGEGVGGGGAKPEAVKGDGWGHREPWSWADPCTPSIPSDARQGCSPSLWSLSPALGRPRLQLHGDSRNTHIRPPRDQRVSACVYGPALQGPLLLGLLQLSGEAGRWGRLI